MQVVRKLLSLSETVANELDKEKNASALVDVVLGDFYGVEVVEMGKGGPDRLAIKVQLANLDPSVNPEPTLADQAVALTGVADVVQPLETPFPPPDATPDPTPTEAPVIAPVADQPSVVEPITVENTTAPVPTEVPGSNAPVAAAVASIDVPVKVNGVPGGYCDKHGVYAGNICIDCL